MTVDATVCHIIKGRRLLLKKATRGISAGKWNGPGGKIEPGETATRGVVREVMEETSLSIINPFYHGKLEFYMNGGRSLDYLVHVFSARRFSGRPRSSEEGEVRWFDVREIPYPEMWDDDRYWLPLLLNGVSFDACFTYDRKNRRVVDYLIKARTSLQPDASERANEVRRPWPR
ncbi:MAG: 8-oxo-dGTP diphosphatase [Nitrososphaerota archaeon]|jgi:8-oxo-dGTP diphosphatase|nr:8-oxo-dGTP diphosphatase [Nitrososphaerota archaeon]MDG6945969.1 8-oxo-dGTP diphosphatase [Nitrososphaerota archaeon]